MSNPNLSRPRVFIVDDDPSVLKSIGALVHSFGMIAVPFQSSQEFLDYYETSYPGCLVTDVRMTKMSGIELQECLLEKGLRIPIIVISGYADVPTIVRAMRNGAVTFLEKPYRDLDLWNAIDEALARDAEVRSAAGQRRAVQERLGRLTSAEVDVLRLMMAGRLNKQISSELGVSLRTVEARRSRLFEKMEVQTVAELVKAAIEAQEPT